MDFPRPLDDDDDEGVAPPLDDDDSAVPPPQDEWNDRDSGIVLQLSVDKDGSMDAEQNQQRAQTSIGGLDQSDLTLTSPAGITEQPTKKRVRGSIGARRMRKRRKVVIDNDATELTGDHIKAMLEDTSDIVRQDIIHPADWVEDAEAPRRLNKKDLGRKLTYDHQHHTARELLYAFLPYEKLMARPYLADDGQLAPELLQLWKRNTSRVLGKPFPYRKRASVAAAAQKEDEESKTVEVEEDIEMARRREDEEEGHPRTSLDDDDFAPPMQQDEEEEDQDMPPPANDDDDDMPPPLDDDDNEEERRKSLAPDGQSKVLFFPGTITSAIASSSPVSRVVGPKGKPRDSVLSLGLVNEFEDDVVDEDDEDREAIGDAVSSTSKWHKHTIKVLAMLKRTLASGDGEDDESKPDHVGYDKLSEGCSRRTAAGVFFELLQLKVRFLTASY